MSEPASLRESRLLQAAHAQPFRTVEEIRAQVDETDEPYLRRCVDWALWLPLVMIHHLTWRSAPNKRFAQRLYVCARVVTQIRRVARAPVLVLSGLDSTEVREQMLQAGATDFILLPNGFHKTEDLALRDHAMDTVAWRWPAIVEHVQQKIGDDEESHRERARFTAHAIVFCIARDPVSARMFGTTICRGPGDPPADKIHRLVEPEHWASVHKLSSEAAGVDQRQGVFARRAGRTHHRLASCEADVHPDPTRFRDGSGGQRADGSGPCTRPTLTRCRWTVVVRVGASKPFRPRHLVPAISTDRSV